MQSGIDTAQTRLAAFDNVTRITVSPDKAAAGSFFGADGLKFSDVLDAINPLQHIPGVSTLYRQLTGDVPSTASKLAGGALLGGPVGFFASLAGVIFESATGNSVEETLVAWVRGDEAPKATNQLARNDVPTNPKDAAVLGLYGASGTSAHQSYQQAQLRPYLNDVTTSRVI